jgi:hypothetical protein
MPTDAHRASCFLKALAAFYTRGSQLVSEVGGCTAMLINEGMSRASASPSESAWRDPLVRVGDIGGLGWRDGCLEFTRGSEYRFRVAPARPSASP